MLKVVIEQIQSSNKNLRSKKFEATMVGDPKIGKPLVFFAEALDIGKDFRYIVTSRLVSIEGNIYETENSTYKIDPDW